MHQTFCVLLALLPLSVSAQDKILDLKKAKVGDVGKLLPSVLVKNTDGGGEKIIYNVGFIANPLKYPFLMQRKNIYSKNGNVKTETLAMIFVKDFALPKPSNDPFKLPDISWEVVEMYAPAEFQEYPVLAPKKKAN